MGVYVAIGMFGLFGLVIFGFAVNSLIETIVFLRKSQKTFATVVRFASKYYKKGGTHYKPVLEFTAPGRQKR